MPILNCILTIECCVLYLGLKTIYSLISSLSNADERKLRFLTMMHSFKKRFVKSVSSRQKRFNIFGLCLRKKIHHFSFIHLICLRVSSLGFKATNVRRRSQRCLCCYMFEERMHYFLKSFQFELTVDIYYCNAIIKRNFEKISFPRSAGNIK